tara:strand:- start:49865 stop:50020 length:156 start_codon:yes stop_codon:yes gene_type:complete
MSENPLDNDDKKVINTNDIDNIIKIIEQLSVAVKKIRSEDLEKILSDYEAG